jgi:formyltetrahydrofolate hydrolase
MPSAPKIRFNGGGRSGRTGSELESGVLNRAIKWHAERRVFRNGSKTVVLK